jgi:hypothetical protein
MVEPSERFSWDGTRATSARQPPRVDALGQAGAPAARQRGRVLVAVITGLGRDPLQQAGSALGRAIAI